MNELSYDQLKDKYDLARATTKQNLLHLKSYSLAGFVTNVFDFLQSTTSSIIVIKENENSKNNKYLEAIQKNEETKKFIEEQLLLLNHLSKLHKKIILDKYIFNRKRCYESLYDEDKHLLSKSKYYKLHDEAINQLIFLNAAIDFSFDDYIKLQMYKKKDIK